MTHAADFEKGKANMDYSKKYFVRKVTVIFCVMTVITGMVWSDPVTFIKTFGGSGNDRAYAVRQTTDRGYIIVGATESFGAKYIDVYLLKLDAAGNEQWHKTYGGDNYELGYDIQQTKDGGFIVVGSTGTYGPGVCAIYMLKTDAAGNEQWHKTFGSDEADLAYSVQQTIDGGYIIAGDTGPARKFKDDVLLIKTDPSGNEQWSKTFGGSESDQAKSVQQTKDDGYIIAGNTDSGQSTTAVYVIKTDAAGNEQWSKTFGGRYSQFGECVVQTEDGAYVIAGWTDSLGAGDDDVYIIKTDGNGNPIWQKMIGGKLIDDAAYIRQTADGGYIIGGKTESFGNGYSDVYIIKIDANGDEIWHKTFGGSDADYGSCVRQTNDGGYIIAGFTKSSDNDDYDVYVIKTDAYGNAGD
jgi:hypothetical protein